jgi:hypothetical protein
MQHDSITSLHPRTKNLLGQPFGRLIVIAFAEYRVHKASGYKHAFWSCRCEEGNVVVVSANQLISGRTLSCGCLRKDVATARLTTHGKSHAREFFIWWNMIERCEMPRKKDYVHYGGRGITVCEAWHDFSTFYADMGPRPTPKHSIERLRNNEGYGPTNCIWAIQAIQVRNTRRNILWTHNGITQCIQDWANQLGINRRTLVSRLRLGWSVQDILTTPVGHQDYKKHTR